MKMLPGTHLQVLQGTWKGYTGTRRVLVGGYPGRKMSTHYSSTTNHDTVHNALTRGFLHCHKFITIELGKTSLLEFRGKLDSITNSVPASALWFQKQVLVGGLNHYGSIGADSWFIQLFCESAAMKLYPLLSDPPPPHTQWLMTLPL